MLYTKNIKQDNGNVCCIQENIKTRQCRKIHQDKAKVMCMAKNASKFVLTPVLYNNEHLQ